MTWDWETYNDQKAHAGGQQGLEYGTDSEWCRLPTYPSLRISIPGSQLCLRRIWWKRRTAHAELHGTTLWAQDFLIALMPMQSHFRMKLLSCQYLPHSFLEFACFAQVFVLAFWIFWEVDFVRLIFAPQVVSACFFILVISAEPVLSKHIGDLKKIQIILFQSTFQRT